MDEPNEIKDFSLTLLNNLPLPVMFVDTNYSIKFVNTTTNKMIKDIFGVDEPAEIQKGVDYLYSIIKSELYEFRLEKKESIYFKKVLTINNNDYFFIITIKKIFDSNNNLLGNVITFQDNSENIKLDAMLCMDVQLSEALNTLAEAILQSMSIDKISVLILDNAKRFTNSKYGFAGYIDPNTGYLIVPTHTREIWNECKVHNKSIEFRDFTGLWGWVLKNKKSILTNQPWMDERRSGTPEGHVPINRFLAVPSLIGKNLVGMIAVANGEYPYSERDLNFLERISSLFALAIQHKFEQDRLESKKNALELANEELKSMQAQIIQQEKMASIGQISAGIAHEINNPMGYIISNLGTLTKYVQRLLEFYEVQRDIIDKIIKELSKDRQDEVISAINEKKQSLKIDHIITDIVNLLKESQEGADRIKKIVLDLKLFARTDEKDFKLSDINSGIESTINIIWNELKYKAKVYKDLQTLPLTKCNIGQLNQVFMNLLVNAVQAIEKEGEIRVKTWHENGFIYVLISDTGCGIPEDKIDKIFNPFFTTKEVGKGTGLGLSIAMDIIKKHNGEIKVESKVGQGTTFTIKIPIVV